MHPLFNNINLVKVKKKSQYTVYYLMSIPLKNRSIGAKSLISIYFDNLPAN
jgi:hypothetical protein